MSNKDMVAAQSAAKTAPGAGLDVQIAAELPERARAEGGSLVGQGGLLQQVTRAVLQAALEAEMADHLGYERGEALPSGSDNHRKARRRRRCAPRLVNVRLDVPRDRNGSCEPKIVP